MTDAGNRRDLPTTLPGLVLDSARRYADRPAVIDGPRTLTFARLADEVLEFARAATAHGVLRGDRVAVWAPNGADWIVAGLGLLTAGATVVTVNTRYRGEEAAELLARSRARLLVVDQGFLGYDHVGALRRAAEDARDPASSSGPVPGLPDLEHVVTLGGHAHGTIPLADFLARAGETDHRAALDTVAALRGDDGAYLIFTSGTTGRPKGVRLLHGPLLRLYQDYSGIWGIRETDRYLCPLPFFHNGGQSALISCLLRGAAILPMAVFDPGELLTLIEKLRVTVLLGAPTIFAALLDHPDRDRHDLSSLRLAATGSAVVPVRLVERARTELPFENFITAYGLTESHGTATMCRADDDPVTVATTNGRALPGVEIRVVDPAGADVPAGASGEVWIRGYNVTPGYLDDPDATAAAIDADGWLRTGDIGHLDENGNLAITDRLKDLYISGGFNVSPAEVEQVMARHPDISEVAVIGVPDDRLGEVGRAYVIPRPGSAPDPGAIRDWCRERLANFKVPRTVTVVTDMPRNATGKVLKTELRAAAGDTA